MTHPPITDEMVERAAKAAEEVEIHAGDRAPIYGNRKLYELLTGWAVRNIVRAALEAALSGKEE